MKKDELKAGELYAMKGYGTRAILLLSVQQIAIERRSGISRYVLSEKRVGRDNRVGYLILRGDFETLRGVDVAQVLDRFLGWEDGMPGSREFLPAGVHPDFLYSLTKIVGPYSEVMAGRREAEALQNQRQADWTREYNEVVDALNAHLDTKLNRASYTLLAPRRVELTTAQVAQLMEAMASGNVVQAAPTG